MPARVRSIGVFGEARAHVAAGSRVALNLPSVDRHLDRARRSGRQQGLCRAFEFRRPLYAARVGVAAACAGARRCAPISARRKLLASWYSNGYPRTRTNVGARLHLRAERPSPFRAYVSSFGGRRRRRCSAAGTSNRSTLRRQRGTDARRSRGCGGAARRRTHRARPRRDRVCRERARRRGARGARPAWRGATKCWPSGDPRRTSTAPPRENCSRGRSSISKRYNARDRGPSASPRSRWRANSASPSRCSCASSRSSSRTDRLAGRSGYYSTLDHQPALSAEQRELFDRLIPRNGAFVSAGAVCRRRGRRQALADRRRRPGARHAARARRVREGRRRLYRGSQIVARSAPASKPIFAITSA